jgi:hypothetical protein
MADKRISQLVERTDIANNDVVPIVASGATTTNKATISSIQEFMQENLDLGVTSVGITLGTTGTDVNVTGSPITTSGNITINFPTASATNRGLLSAADWTTFNNKQAAGNYVTLDTAQTITAQKTFTTSGSSDTMIISHGSGSGFALDVIKAGNSEAIRVTKTSGSGNAMTVIGGNFEAPTIVKTGGTSSQFLKADGSVDSSTYLTTASASAAYVPYTGANANLDLGQFDLFADTIRVNGSNGTGSYLGFKHATTVTTGAEGYTSMYTFGTNIIGYKSVSGATNKDFSFDMSSITANVSGGRVYTLPDASGTLALTSNLGAYLPLAGGTLTGALNGTSASFTGGLTFGDFKTDANVLKSNKPNEQGAFLRAAVSTASNPTFAFEDDEDTGMYRVTTNSLGFTTGGTNALTLASTGAATFSSSVTAVNAVLGNTSENTNSIQINGVNTTRTHIGTGFGATFISNNAFFNGSAYAFDDNTLPNSQITLSAGQIFLSTGAANTDPSAKLTVLNNGNVGIGTDSPGFRLDVSSNVAEVMRLRGGAGGGSNNNTQLRFYGANAATDLWAIGTEVSTGGTDRNFDFYDLVAGQNRLRITSGGDILIGTTSTRPDEANDEGRALWANGKQFVYSTSDWFVGNTNSVGSKLAFRYLGSNVGDIAITAVSTSYNVTSDYRLKEDLQEIKGLQKVQAIKVYDYKWKSQESRMDGVLAHELAEILPYAVTGEKDEVDEEGKEKMQGVDYSKIVPILIKAIQEQQEQIDSLKNQIK